MSEQYWVHLDVEYIMKETDLAFLVTLDHWEGEFWIPKSQLADSDEYKKGMKNCTMSIKQWLAEELGIEENPNYEEHNA